MNITAQQPHHCTKVEVGSSEWSPCRCGGQKTAPVFPCKAPQLTGNCIPNDCIPNDSAGIIPAKKTPGTLVPDPAPLWKNSSALSGETRWPFTDMLFVEVTPYVEVMGTTQLNNPPTRDSVLSCQWHPCRFQQHPSRNRPLLDQSRERTPCRPPRSS